MMLEDQEYIYHDVNVKGPFIVIAKPKLAYGKREASSILQSMLVTRIQKGRIYSTSRCGIVCESAGWRRWGKIRFRLCVV